MDNFCDGVVQNIERTECIGDSRQKINSNFLGLKEAGCALEERTTAVENRTTAVENRTTTIENTYVKQLSAGNNITLTPSSGTGNLIKIDSFARPTYVNITGVQSGGVIGTDDLSTVTGLSYNSGFATKNGTATYTISKLQGPGLDTTRITDIHVVAKVGEYAGELGRKSYIMATYPDGSYQPVLTIPSDQAGTFANDAIVCTTVSTTCRIPINSDTATVTLSVNVDYAAHGEFAYYEIIGATIFK